MAVERGTLSKDHGHQVSVREREGATVESGRRLLARLERVKSVRLGIWVCVPRPGRVSAAVVVFVITLLLPTSHCRSMRLFTQVLSHV